MRIKVVITENLTRVFECESLNFIDGGDIGLNLYREKDFKDQIALIPNYLYWEDITEKESTELIENAATGKQLEIVNPRGLTLGDH